MIARVAKAVVLGSLPLTLAWAGWVYGTSWHPTEPRVRCGSPLPRGRIFLGDCHALRPLWISPDGLALLGAVIGVIAVSLVLLALHRGVRRGRLPMTPEAIAG